MFGMVEMIRPGVLAKHALGLWDWLTEIFHFLSQFPDPGT